MTTNANRFRIISDQEPQVIDGRDDLFSALSVYLDTMGDRPAGDSIYLQEQVEPGMWKTIRSTKTDPA